MGEQCCPVDPKERDRNFANAIRGRADSLVAAGKFDAGRKLLDAAWALLDTTADENARECETGLWLLASEANLLQNNGGDKEVAVENLRQALALSEKLFGADHPCTAVCVANVGEGLREAGKPDEARPFITRASELLAKAQPTGAYTEEYLGGIRAHVAKMTD